MQKTKSNYTYKYTSQYNLNTDYESLDWFVPSLATLMTCIIASALYNQMP